MKNVEKPLKNLQKYRKIVKNDEKFGKIVKNVKKPEKTSKKILICQKRRKHGKTIKMSETGKKLPKISKNRLKC